jgi:hypothetical protein
MRSSSSQLASDVHQLLEGTHPLSCGDPLSCCDACLALQFGVSLSEATAVTLKLATKPGYVRESHTCDMCRRTLELTFVAVKPRPRT